jgi:hypothetical protein
MSETISESDMKPQHAMDVSCTTKNGGRKETTKHANEVTLERATSV